MKYHDSSSFATDSIGISVNMEKLKFLMPELFTPIQRLKYALRNWGLESHIEFISEQIKFGDSQGAIVVNCEPLLIAGYNEDIDCVVMLRYEEKIQKRYKFAVGDRLICVNTFGDEGTLQADLIVGDDRMHNYTIVHPVIADLISSDSKALSKRKLEIGDKGYKYIEKLAKEYLVLKPNTYRNGKPIVSALVGFQTY